MSSLHVFTDGINYYAAETLKEAQQMQVDLYGSLAVESVFWKQRPDDEEFSVWMEREEVTEHGNGRLETRTFKQWAEELGPGFLFTTEY